MKLLFLNLLALSFLMSCHHKNSISKGQSKSTLNKDSTIQSPNNDSTEIVKLLKEVYKWHDQDRSNLIDFDIIVKDSFQTGLNFKSFNNKFDALKKTNFFSQSFLDNYKKIGMYINNKLTNANPKYLNEINFAFQDADPWTGFQDDAPNFWNDFIIVDFKSSFDSASLKWSIKDWTSEKHPVKFSKENSKWKVSYIEGFDMDEYYK
jgi:hypothetical protein